MNAKVEDPSKKNLKGNPVGEMTFEKGNLTQEAEIRSISI
jgi:hypothetical protein